MGSLLYICYMKQIFIFFILYLCFGVLESCDNNSIDKPAYLNIQELFMSPSPNLPYGNSSSKISSVWIKVNNNNIGAFELPVEIPVIIDNDGSYDLKIEPGIDINGVSTFRGIYPFYNPIELSIGLEKGKTIDLPIGSSKIVSYNFDAPQGDLQIKSLETFESGVRTLSATNQSDTNWILTSDSNIKFSPPQGESNIYSGMAILDTGICKFEVSSIDNFVLPKGGENVYLEFDYRTTNPLTIGVIAINPGQIIQMPTATFLPTSEWNHGYVNLVTEVSGSPQASSFKIFIGSAKLNNGVLDTVLIDNVKLLYYE